MSRFIISPGARADLDKIWDYVAVTNENPTAARKRMKAFRNACTVLGNHQTLELCGTIWQPAFASFLWVGTLSFFARPTTTTSPSFRSFTAQET